MGWGAIRLRDHLLKALVVVQAALFASISHNMEMNHFAIDAFPALIFVAVAADHLLKRPSPALRSMLDPILDFSAGATLATVTATLVAWSIFSPAGAQYFAGSTWNVDLLGHRPKAISSPRVASARAIYAGPFLPGLYYLLGKKNPFFVSETIVCNEACQRQLVAELVAVRPELAFLDYAMVGHLGYDQSAPVDAYLREHYTPCAWRTARSSSAPSEARFCP